MIAHFVGGPWHGNDRQVEDGTPRVLGVKQAPPVRWDAPASEILDTVPYETFEYARAGKVGGFEVFEYVEPTAEVEFVIRKRVPESQVKAVRDQMAADLYLKPGSYVYYSGPARD